MTLEEIDAELALIILAKAKIYEHAQTYGLAGGNTERANLATLISRQNYLEQLKAVTQNNGSFGCNQVVFGGRR